MTPVGAVYVHAPFCVRRCFYCDFAVTVDRAPDAHPWLDAIGQELDLLKQDGLFELAPVLASLYVGGGTPSLLGPSAMEGLAHAIGGERLHYEGLEWTVEANPESLTGELARAWADAGVNRISLGAQSFQESALHWMGRLHGPDGPARAVDAARAAGIHNISVDLIFGLPSVLGRDWEADLRRVLELDVPHLSLYGLTVESDTPLGRAVAEGSVTPIDEERYRDEYLAAASILGDAGYEHYEISNFARPGFQSRHNGTYWSGAPYLGLGNSAHSYQAPMRRWNLSDWAAYSRTVAEGVLPIAEEESVSASSARLERIWLGLRTRAGLRQEVLQAAVEPVIRGWVGRGLAEVGAGIVRLTPEGWLLMDHLAVELDEAWTDDEASGGDGLSFLGDRSILSDHGSSR